ncbi:MAG: hypothetical protein L6Q54_13575 [Leptospiraceae bacterium]|nr:hypothetical protein [Leptospiraceae bacterium]
MRAGHFTKINSVVKYAAENNKKLPPGTYLGSTKGLIGYTSNSHLHVDGRRGNKSVPSQEKIKTILNGENK